MAKRTVTDSKLVAAAIAFDEQLAYARCRALKTPSARQLERVNQTLLEIAATEARLGATGQELAQAIGQAHAHQQQLAEQMVAHRRRCGSATRRCTDIVAELQQFGEVTRAINADAAAARRSRSRPGSPSRHPRRGSGGTGAHRRLRELGSQAHALHQQMLALARAPRRLVGEQAEADVERAVTRRRWGRARRKIRAQTMQAAPATAKVGGAEAAGQRALEEGAQRIPPVKATAQRLMTRPSLS
jgi:hypothetical protein